MEDNQKYGVLTMIVSFLLILLTLMVSEGWRPDVDFVANLLNHLKFIPIEYSKGSFGHFVTISPINIPTKYLILGLISFSSYGLTTYLGITTAFRPWEKPSTPGRNN